MAKPYVRLDKNEAAVLLVIIRQDCCLWFATSTRINSRTTCWRWGYGEIFWSADHPDHQL